ncbi:MAG: hypothetical protein ACRDB9_10285 [Cetobacterium sp.]
MKFLSKKKYDGLESRIAYLNEQISYLKNQLNIKRKDNLRLSGELYSKTVYAEDYVKMYCEARDKSARLEEEKELYKNKSETQCIMIEKLKSDLYILKKENDKVSKKLEVYEDKAKEAYNDLVQKGSTKRLKKKKEKALYYTLLDAQKK